MIPLLIGKNSNGEDRFLDLSNIALLMVSYCEEKQISAVFKHIQGIVYPNKQFNYVIANSRRLNECQISVDEAYVFLRDDPESGSVNSRLKLLKMINKEMMRRQKIIRLHKVKDFDRYVSLNVWNKEKVTYQFLLIDDIWDIVTSSPRSLALNLINIFINGPTYGIHTVFASGVSYRNLLEQLVKLNPKISLELQKRYGVPEPKTINLLGSELIFTSEELIFYRPYATMAMERLFKI